MKYILSFFIITFSIYLYGQQGLINKGSKIVIEEGSILVIQDDYVNQSLNENQHGEIISDGEIIIGGNWYNNTLSNQVFSSINDHGVVNFTAASNQIIGGASSSNFENLSVNNSGLLLNADISISNSISLVDGIVQLGDNNLILDSDVIFTGDFSNTNMIATNGSGNIRQILTEKGNFFYPLGDIMDNAEYSPAEVTINEYSGSDGAYMSVRVDNEVYDLLEEYPDFINRYWEINGEAINSIDYDVMLHYHDDDIVGDENNLFATRFVNEIKTIHDPVYTIENTVEVYNNTEAAIFTAASNLVGIEQFNEPDAFRIFPNPSNGHFKLESNIDFTSNVEVEIFDEKGVMVTKNKFIASDYNYSFAIDFDVQFLSKGVYILKIYNDQQITKRKLVIK